VVQWQPVSQLLARQLGLAGPVQCAAGLWQSPSLKSATLLLLALRLMLGITLLLGEPSSTAPSAFAGTYRPCQWMMSSVSVPLLMSMLAPSTALIRNINDHRRLPAHSPADVLK